MKLFARNIKKKQVENLEKRILDLIKDQFPNLIDMMTHSELFDINFITTPPGIQLTHSFTGDYFEKNQSKHTTQFRLLGIKLMHKSTGEFKEISLIYSFDSLSIIEVKDPKRFHKNYDLEQIKIGKLVKEDLPILNENEDKEKVEKILKNLSKQQLERLEFDFTFEIEFEGKNYYTIIDLEEGNYIAIDENGFVYKLIHDHAEPIKKIKNSVEDFLLVHNDTKEGLIEKYD